MIFDERLATAWVQAQNVIAGREPDVITDHMRAGMEYGACRYHLLRERAELRILYGLGFEHAADLVMQRMREILLHDAAKGHEAQAVELAFDPHVSFEDAIGRLMEMQQADKDAHEAAVH